MRSVGMDTRSFVRDHLANPVLLVGAVVALTAGMGLGSFLKAGEIFQERAAPQVIVNAATSRVEPVSFMTDANGRIPAYVIGTDRLYQPEPLPMIRTAWDDEPVQVIEDVSELPTMVSNTELPAQPVAYAAPPSESGDILAVSAAAQPSPVG